MPSDEEIDNAVAEANTRWPGLNTDAGALRASLAKHPVDTAQLVEMCLVSACLQQSTVALRALEREYLAALRPHAARLLQDQTEVDDLMQLTRMRLLAGERPRLNDYEGRGSLMGWLKTVLTRLGLNELKSKTRHERREETVSTPPEIGLENDPTLHILRDTHRADFDAALTEGWERLTSQQRTVLKMSIIDGLSIDRIAAVYGAHRATAARWIERGKIDLLDAAREALGRRLALAPHELESLLRSLGSHLDMSIRSLMVG